MDSTQPFTVSRNTVLMTMIMSPSTGWLIWIVLFVGLILIGIGCFMDYRYLIIGLILCFTVIPTMAFFLFVNFMFASEMVANLLHHTIERRHDSYLIHILRPADQDNPVERDKVWIESGRLTIFDSNVVRKKLTPEYEVLFLENAPLSVLYVPRY